MASSGDGQRTSFSMTMIRLSCCSLSMWLSRVVCTAVCAGEPDSANSAVQYAQQDKSGSKPVQQGCAASGVWFYGCRRGLGKYLARAKEACQYLQDNMASVR